MSSQYLFVRCIVERPPVYNIRENKDEWEVYSSVWKKYEDGSWHESLNSCGNFSSYEEADRVLTLIRTR